MSVTGGDVACRVGGCGVSLCGESCPPPQMLHKAVKDKQRSLAKLQQEIKEKKKENAALDQELRELQVCILERREIEELAGKCCQACHSPWHLPAEHLWSNFAMCSQGPHIPHVHTPQ